MKDDKVTVMNPMELRDAWAAADSAPPFGPYSDLECLQHDCFADALIEDGVRIHYCAKDLKTALERAVQDRATIVRRGLVIDARDLTHEQRHWPVPEDQLATLDEWPFSDRTEVWDGVLRFENRWSAPWTWRSVALAARVYPNYRVRLVRNHLQIARWP